MKFSMPYLESFWRDALGHGDGLPAWFYFRLYRNQLCGGADCWAGVDGNGRGSAVAGIMLAVNLQTSFLTPPFGFALFYLRGIAPESIATESIYKGVIPFIAIQIGLLILMAIFPDIVTKLPSIIYS